jgi:hypothetical protein
LLWGFAKEPMPRSRGKPAGRLDQPFYGWFTSAREIYRGRFSGLTGAEIEKAVETASAMITGTL